MIGLVDVGSTELFVSAVGAGPTVLLISGTTGTAEDWTVVARMLADEFTVVTYDRPRWARGRGPTAQSHVDQLASSLIGLAQRADDAAGLLRVLHLAPAVVVGHGGGGSVACELVAHHPKLVRLAVVCEAHATYAPDVDRLRASGVPMAVLGCEPSGDAGPGATDARLAASTGATRWSGPGGPVGLPTHPDAFVAVLRDIVHNGGRS
jgi:pimeloyl-ACP methyl ester carboxylesterase